MKNASNTSKTGFSFAFYTENAKESMKIAREFFKKKVGTFGTCLKMAWAKIRATVSGKVTFMKVETGELLTRTIEPVEKYSGYTSMSAKFPGLMMAVDMDKVRSGKEPKASIISFYLQHVQ